MARDITSAFNTAIKAKYVKDGSMSRRVGTYLDDCTNIHSEEDLNQAEKNILTGRHYNG